MYLLPPDIFAMCFNQMKFVQNLINWKGCMSHFTRFIFVLLKLLLFSVNETNNDVNKYMFGNVLT